MTVMTPDDILSAMAAHHISLTPTLNPDGSIMRWQAGKRLVRSNGMNYVPPDGFAWGVTPSEAVAKLLAGETAYRWEESGYVEVEKWEYKYKSKRAGR